jgi:putative spermidine/putrescine transport system substrate-binding protein
MTTIARGTAALATLALLTGPALAQMTEAGEPEGELSIIAWAGYIERGETDPAFDWVTAFEEETAASSPRSRPTPPTRWWPS